MRLRSSCLTSLSFACMRSRRLFRCTRNWPRSDFPQTKRKPRNVKVSGLHSDYSQPHVHKLTAEDRRATLAAFDAVADWLYANRAPHGQRVSAHYRDVLRYLLSLGMRFGKVFPSYQRIAEACACSRRTVASALAWLH